MMLHVSATLRFIEEMTYIWLVEDLGALENSQGRGQPCSAGLSPRNRTRIAQLGRTPRHHLCRHCQ